MNYIWPGIRKWILRKPCTAYFKIDSQEDDANPTTITVRENSRVEIQMRLVPRISYVETGYIFGFTGHPNKKPIPKSIVNTFIANGINREQSPNDTPEHFVDYKGNYHIARERTRIKGTTYAIGFRIETGKPGEYELFMNFLEEEGIGRLKNKLKIIVT